MPNTRTCSLRRTRPRGPMRLCGDLVCYEECVETTRVERDQMVEPI